MPLIPASKCAACSKEISYREPRFYSAYTPADSYCSEACLKSKEGERLQKMRDDFKAVDNRIVTALQGGETRTAQAITHIGPNEPVSDTPIQSPFAEYQSKS